MNSRKNSLIGEALAKALRIGVGFSFMVVLAGFPSYAGSEQEPARTEKLEETSVAQGSEHKQATNDQQNRQQEGQPESLKPNKSAKIDPNLLPGGDPRGVPDLIICSQNLKLFGTFDTMSRANPGFTRPTYDQKVADLVACFWGAKCEIVAVQEVIGKTPID